MPSDSKIHENLNRKTSAELQSIMDTRDESKWSDEAFAEAERILSERKTGNATESAPMDSRGPTAWQRHFDRQSRPPPLPADRLKNSINANLWILLGAISVWLLLDFCHVKFHYPTRLDGHGLNLGPWLLPTIVTNLWLNRQRKPGSMILHAFIWTAIVGALFFVAILTVGIAFHCGIGGGF
jgi:hypothetical protein